MRHATRRELNWATFHCGCTMMLKCCCTVLRSMQCAGNAGCNTILSLQGRKHRSHTRPLPPRDLIRSSSSGKFALNSVKPNALPSRSGSQLALKMPYVMPTKPPPNVSSCTIYTTAIGKSTCCVTCTVHCFLDLISCSMAVDCECLQAQGDLLTFRK